MEGVGKLARSRWYRQMILGFQEIFVGKPPPPSPMLIKDNFEKK
jgi:hypothetical protein